MKNIIIRVTAWFSTFFYALMSLACLLIIFEENFDIYILIMCLLFLVMAVTGFFTRNFGLAKLKSYTFLKPLTNLSLIFTLFFVVAAPLIFIINFGDIDSVVASVALLVLFFPGLLTSSAILFSNEKQ